MPRVARLPPGRMFKGGERGSFPVGEVVEGSRIGGCERATRPLRSGREALRQARAVRPLGCRRSPSCRLKKGEHEALRVLGRPESSSVSSAATRGS